MQLFFVSIKSIIIKLKVVHVLRAQAPCLCIHRTQTSSPHSCADTQRVNMTNKAKNPANENQRARLSPR